MQLNLLQLATPSHMLPVSPNPFKEKQQTNSASFGSNIFSGSCPLRKSLRACKSVSSIEPLLNCFETKNISSSKPKGCRSENDLSQYFETNSECDSNIPLPLISDLAISSAPKTPETNPTVFQEDQLDPLDPLDSLDQVESTEENNTPQQSPRSHLPHFLGHRRSLSLTEAEITMDLPMDPIISSASVSITKYSSTPASPRYHVPERIDSRSSFWMSPDISPIRESIRPRLQDPVEPLRNFRLRTRKAPAKPATPDSNSLNSAPTNSAPTKHSSNLHINLYEVRRNQGCRSVSLPEVRPLNS